MPSSTPSPPIARNELRSSAMRIGLPGFGTTVDQVVKQAERAEAEGFKAVWYPSAVLGDPLIPMAIAGP